MGLHYTFLFDAF